MSSPFDRSYLHRRYNCLTKTTQDYRCLCNSWNDKFKYPYELIESNVFRSFDFDCSTITNINEYNKLVKILNENSDDLNECELKVVKNGITNRISQIKSFCYNVRRYFIDTYDRRKELEDVEKKILEYLFKKYLE